MKSEGYAEDEALQKQVEDVQDFLSLAELTVRLQSYELVFLFSFSCSLRCDVSDFYGLRA